MIGHSQNHSCSSALSFLQLLHACSAAQSCLTLRPHGIACQAPLSIGFLRQESWSGLPFPSPGDLPDAGIRAHLLWFLHWQVDFSFFLSFFLFFTTEPPGKPHNSFWTLIQVVNCFLGEAPAISRMLTITKILEENSKYVIQSLPYKPWGESRQRHIDSK